MATHAEIANDLDAQARALEGRHRQGRQTDPEVRAMRRGAEAIRELLRKVRDLEEAAEAEAMAFEQYRQGAEFEP